MEKYIKTPEVLHSYLVFLLAKVIGACFDEVLMAGPVLSRTTSPLTVCQAGSKF